MIHFVEEYKKYAKENRQKVVEITPRLLAKFKQLVCELKIGLTAEETADFNVDVPEYEVEDFSRDEFEVICKSIFDRILIPVTQVLEKAGM